MRTVESLLIEFLSCCFFSSLLSLEMIASKREKAKSISFMMSDQNRLLFEMNKLWPMNWKQQDLKCDQTPTFCNVVTNNRNECSSHHEFWKATETHLNM